MENGTDEHCFGVRRLVEEEKRNCFERKVKCRYVSACACRYENKQMLVARLSKKRTKVDEKIGAQLNFDRMCNATRNGRGNKYCGKQTNQSRSRDTSTVLSASKHVSGWIYSIPSYEIKDRPKKIKRDLLQLGCLSAGRENYKQWNERKKQAYLIEFCSLVHQRAVLVYDRGLQ